MKRKDGLPKVRAARNKPVFDVGHKDSLNAQKSRYDSDPESPIRLLSLFSGCGGLDLGFHGGFEWMGIVYHRTNFEIVNAFDFDADCVDAYRLNLGASQRCDLSDADVASLPYADVVAGGFPCQEFSSSGSKMGTVTDRGKLYQVLVRYADYHRPRIVVGENVPMLETLNGGVYLDEIRAAFRMVGYKVQIWRVVCQQHGLPQSRTRLFIIATNIDEAMLPNLSLPFQTMYIDEALRDLEHVADEQVPNQSQFYVATTATSGGGQGDHANERGRFAYTIRANPRGRVQFHYSLPRRLTVRECARVQGFPDSFIFPQTTQRNMKLIGNAVPPPIAHAVAMHLQRVLLGLPIERHQEEFVFS
jgi:DNA (cytosine-5)-methyltransferase 1